MSERRLGDRVAMVTGGLSGIGLAIARRLTADGAVVAVVDISPEGEPVDSLVGPGTRFYRADVSDADEVTRLLGEVTRDFGRLDILCNNAGIDGEFGALAECSVENFDRVMAVNARGVFLTMKYALPLLLASPYAAVVNVASAVGLVGQVNLSSYAASKGAVIQLTRSAAGEYSARGVRINALCPGVVETPLAAQVMRSQPEILQAVVNRHPIGRLGTPDEIAAAAAFLVSDDAGFITGAALSVDGGFGAV